MLVPPFEHTYQSICSQFISATPSVAEPARRADPSLAPEIVMVITLDDGTNYTANGCRQ